MKGICHCGRIEIEARAVRPVGIHCYCSICRRISGGAGSTTVLVERADFRIVRGAELLARYQATPTANRFHCPVCHAPIYSEEPERPAWGVFVPAGLLDGNDIAHVVFDHIFVANLPSWHKIRDDRPQHPGLPSETP